MGAVVLDGFAGLDDLGDAFENGGILMESVRKSPPCTG